MTLPLLHSEFPYIWGKFDFLFHQCIDRVLGLFSSRRNCDTPTPSSTGECALPPFGSKGRGGAHSLAGERWGGGGGDQFRRGDTEVLWMGFMCPHRQKRTKTIFVKLYQNHICKTLNGSLVSENNDLMYRENALKVGWNTHQNIMHQKLKPIATSRCLDAFSAFFFNSLKSACKSAWRINLQLHTTSAKQRRLLGQPITFPRFSN